MKSLNLSSGIELLYPQCEEVRQAAEMLRTQHEQIKVLREALDKLARLGNNPLLGNSFGNQIAQQALENTEPT